MMDLDQYLREREPPARLDVTLEDPDHLANGAAVTVTVHELRGGDADRLARAQSSQNRILETVALFTQRPVADLEQLPTAWIAVLYDQGLRFNRLGADEAPDEGN